MNTVTLPHNIALKLHRRLRQYVAKPSSNVSICHIALIRSSPYGVVLYRWLTKQFMLWPEFSGHSMFPVPHPTKPGHIAYMECEDFLANDEYGSNRRNLVSFLLTRLDEQIDEHNITT